MVKTAAMAAKVRRPDGRAPEEVANSTAGARRAGWPGARRCGRARRPARLAGPHRSFLLSMPTAELCRTERFSPAFLVIGISSARHSLFFASALRSEEHTSELQSLRHLV